MTDTSLVYVRKQMVAPSPAPNASVGIVGWMRRNLFSSIPNTIMTVVGVLFLSWALPPLLNFIFFKAVWFSDTVEPCKAEGAGACWPFIWDRFDFFMYGFYPLAEQWRINVCFVLGLVLVVPLLWTDLPGKTANAILFFVVYPVFVFFMLNGGVFGLEPVPTEMWGGLTVTLIIGVTGIIASLPIGVVLALGRQSSLPVIKSLSIIFIEVWRSVPLITVLFMASVMLPLFAPAGVTVDKLLRALIGVSLFASAYMAEVVRGGLQALPKGQYEAADSLGLNYWKSMFLIILPQALKHVIPGIVNTFIALFKDTSLVSIVGIFDLLQTVKSANSDLNWASQHSAVTGYLFAAAVFWIFTFSMSRYSIYTERRLHTGHKR